MAFEKCSGNQRDGSAEVPRGKDDRAEKTALFIKLVSWQ